VRFERLVIEAGPNTLALPLHPRLTVVCGLERSVREALASELINALGPGRSGVHLEVVDNAGRHLAVFRPVGGRHTVVDVRTSRDVTDQFTDDDARIDLLGVHGLSLHTARRTLLFSSSALTSAARSGAFIRRLAQIDQTDLWAAAATVRLTDDELQRESDAIGHLPDDPDVVDRIERNHQGYEAAVEHLRLIRKLGFMVGGVAGLASVITAAYNAFLALALAAITVFAAGVAVVYRRRADRAAEEEAEGLAEAGANTYLGFQLRRVDGLVLNEQHRRRLTHVAAEHREASAVWAALAGSEVGVEWALEHHEQIVTAARMRNEGSSADTVISPDGDTAAAAAHAVIARLAQLRTLGTGGESFPLVLDEPFRSLDPGLQPALLEMLVRTTTDGQAVLLTDDDAIASWARLEAMTGVLAVLEPTPSGAERAPAPSGRVDANYQGQDRRGDF
jgi:hypothetical protein